MVIVDTCPVCGHELTHICIATYPPIPAVSCPKYGYYWEGEQDEVVYRTFVPPEGGKCKSTGNARSAETLTLSYNGKKEKTGGETDITSSVITESVVVAQPEAYATQLSKPKWYGSKEK